MNIKFKQRGFTLIELMIVVALMALVASIAIPLYRGNVVAGRTTECTNEIVAIQTAQEEFFFPNNTYVTGTLDGVNNVTTLVANLNPFYTPSANLLTVQANCLFTVTPGPTGIASSYTLTVTGANNLDPDNTAPVIAVINAP